MMARQLSNDDRRVLAEVLKRVGANWRSSIGDDDFHSSEEPNVRSAHQPLPRAGYQRPSR